MSVAQQLKTTFNGGISKASSMEVSACSSILGVGTALPPNAVDQESLANRLRELWSEQHGASRQWRSLFEQIFHSVHVDRRYLALPLNAYPPLDSFKKTNTAWVQIAPELGAMAAEQALAKANLSAQDIDHLFFITGTGVATPSVDALIVNRLGMRSDVRRTPIFGLGCAGGVAGIGRAADLLRGFSEDTALVGAV